MRRWCRFGSSSSGLGALYTSTPRRATLTRMRGPITSTPVPAGGRPERRHPWPDSLRGPARVTGRIGRLSDVWRAPSRCVSMGRAHHDGRRGRTRGQVTGNGPGLMLVHGFGGAKEDFADTCASARERPHRGRVRSSGPRRERQARGSAGVLLRPPRCRHARRRGRGRLEPLPAARSFDGRHGRPPDRARPSGPGRGVGTDGHRARSGTRLGRGPHGVRAAVARGARQGRC